MCNKELLDVFNANSKEKCIFDQFQIQRNFKFKIVWKMKELNIKYVYCKFKRCLNATCKEKTKKFSQHLIRQKLWKKSCSLFIIRVLKINRSFRSMHYFQYKYHIPFYSIFFQKSSRLSQFSCFFKLQYFFHSTKIKKWHPQWQHYRQHFQHSLKTIQK